jgi:hypothetical protein
VHAVSLDFGAALLDQLGRGRSGAPTTRAALAPRGGQRANMACKSTTELVGDVAPAGVHVGELNLRLFCEVRRITE